MAFCSSDRGAPERLSILLPLQPSWNKQDLYGLAILTLRGPAHVQKSSWISGSFDLHMGRAMSQRPKRLKPFTLNQAEEKREGRSSYKDS